MLVLMDQADRESPNENHSTGHCAYPSGNSRGLLHTAEVERRGRLHVNALVLRTDTLAGARLYEGIGYEQIARSETATHRRHSRCEFTASLNCSEAVGDKGQQRVDTRNWAPPATIRPLLAVHRAEMTAGLLTLVAKVGA